MIRPNGDVVATGRVVLKHHDRDVFIIDRSRLSRVYAPSGGSQLSWFNQGEEGCCVTVVGSDWLPKIFDAIVFEAGDIVFVEQADPAGWIRMQGTLGLNTHPVNQK